MQQTAKQKLVAGSTAFLSFLGTFASLFAMSYMRLQEASFMSSQTEILLSEMLSYLFDLGGMILWTIGNPVMGMSFLICSGASLVILVINIAYLVHIDELRETEAQPA